ncbi:hypothetical protein KI387_001567, partial [Taxus chinensis]
MASLHEREGLKRTSFLIVLVLLLQLHCRGVESVKVPALFVFGDSTVDPGNNNYLSTPFKSNHSPYGRDFINHKPSGRFSNGKLVTDFIAEGLGLKETVPAYLDQALTTRDLITGVSFASASSGYDDLTAQASSALPLRGQLQLFKKYRKRLGEMVGEREASNIIRQGLYLCSTGTNDLTIGMALRARQFGRLEQYQDFLLQAAHKFIQELYSAGARKVAFVGVPAVGCLPVERAAERFIIKKNECADEPNQAAISFNEKLILMVPRLRSLLPQLKLQYVDIYNISSDVVHNPNKY